MTTEQTAQQLELAAQILRTGHPFQIKVNGEFRTPSYKDVMNYIGTEIRPVLATPPDNRPLHNPDNLTAEQVGVGWRLVLPEEMDGRFQNGLDKCEWWSRGQGWRSTNQVFAHKCLTDTLRVPLQTPWPEPADPYAELKAAHAAGKVIQYRATRGDWSDWPKDQTPDWLALNTLWRIKPEPAFQLPPPPPGMRWHREDAWKSDDLPSGYRPLVFEEQPQKGDEYRRAEKHWEPQIEKALKVLPTHDQVPQRTTRPLTFEHAGKTWTWHRPGDPMPCDGDRDVCCLVTKGGHRETNSAKGRYMGWSVTDDKLHFWGVIIGWRYADEKKTVPLGPQDVPPGSVLQKHDDGTYYTPLCVSTANDGVYLHDTCPFKQSYENLSEEWKINRSIPLTGKWDPTAWTPCHKTAPQNG